MLFWELRSAFHSEEDVVREVLSQPRWSEPYLGWLDDIDELVTTQRRAVLDSPVPVELSRAIAARSKFVYVYLLEWHQIRQVVSESDRDRGPVLTALEVHDRYGGSAIEQMREKGAVAIQENGLPMG